MSIEPLSHFHLLFRPRKKIENMSSSDRFPLKPAEEIKTYSFQQTESQNKNLVLTSFTHKHVERTSRVVEPISGQDCPLPDLHLLAEMSGHTPHEHPFKRHV